MERIKNWIGRFWVQHLIACWGLFGVGALWAAAAEKSQLLYVAAGLFVVSLVIVTLRAVLFPEDFQNDWMRICGTLGYLGCACAAYFFADLVAVSHRSVGLGVWGVAFVLNLICIGRFTYLLLKDGFDWEKVVPVCALVYCTPGVAALTGAELGMELLCKVLTVYAALASALLLYGITRYVRFQDLPDQYVPGETALTAAPSVAAVAWMANFGASGTVVAIALVLIGQIFLARMVLNLPIFLNLAVGPSFAHFIFPFAIAAQALYELNVVLFGELYSIGAMLFKIELFLATFVAFEMMLALTLENVRRMRPAKKVPKITMPAQKMTVAGAFCDITLYNKMLDSRLSDLCDLQLADVIKTGDGAH